jgi:hypothetical protein
MRKKGKIEAKTKRATRSASKRSTKSGSNQPTASNSLEGFEFSDNTPLSIPGISNFGQLYEVYGRYSDRQFPRRVYGGAAFRLLVESGRDEEWLRTLCEEVAIMRYERQFVVRGRGLLRNFQRALAKAVKEGAALNSLPSGSAYGEMRHELLLCLEHMQSCEKAIKAFVQGCVWGDSAPGRGAPPDKATEHFLWQVDHFPWVSPPADRLLLRLYRDVIGKDIDLDSFRRARRRNRRANPESPQSPSSSGQK